MNYEEPLKKRLEDATYLGAVHLNGSLDGNLIKRYLNHELTEDDLLDIAKTKGIKTLLYSISEYRSELEAKPIKAKALKDRRSKGIRVRYYLSNKGRIYKTINNEKVYYFYPRLDCSWKKVDINKFNTIKTQLISEEVAYQVAITNGFLTKKFFKE